MEKVHSMRMLAVFALVLLVSSVNGRFLTKCELKVQLDAAQFQVPDNMILENLIASLVCRANGSAFNTKFVKFVTDNHNGNIPLQSSSPPAPNGFPQGAPAPNGFPQGAPAPNGFPQGAPAPNGFPQGPPRPGPKHSEPQEVESQGPKDPRKPKRFARQERDLQHPAVWHQFGLFQLSDTVACDSAVLPSLNICKMNCSALIDDDIMDDIFCLKTLMQEMKLVEQVNKSPGPITMEDLLGKECEHVDASHFFAECV